MMYVTCGTFKCICRNMYVHLCESHKIVAICIVANVISILHIHEANCDAHKHQHTHLITCCGWVYICRSALIYTKYSNILTILIPIIKSPRSGVTLCVQFVSAASASASAKTFPSHVKSIWDKPFIYGTKNIWAWGNVLDYFSVTLTQGHGCGVH